MRPAVDQQVTFLYAHDLAETVQFYEDILGLPLVLDQGNCRIYRVSGNAFLGFCRKLSEPGKGEGIILTGVIDATDP
jgi:catechol 2,3-dioxygenase-like lactoylglutathione lyase family enzyme